jgi:hypothetical protein
MDVWCLIKVISKSDDVCRMFLKGFLMRIQYCLPPMAVITLLSVTVNLQKTHTDYKDCADFRLR